MNWTFLRRLKSHPQGRSRLRQLLLPILAVVATVLDNAFASPAPWIFWS
jgi:hypothetical protein